MNESQSRRIVRFGVFEVDLASEELRKNGLKIRLSGQPFQILSMLLDRPGEVVTREDLQKKLWPDGTFVDFDHSLNTAVNKIREALGDSAENPRFVETLARRGYRFIAPVENGSGRASRQPGNSAVVLPRPSSEDASFPLPEPSPPAMAAHRQTGAGRRRLAGLVLVGVLLLAAGVAAWRFSRQASETPPPLRLTRLTSDSGLTTDGVISPDGKLVAYASDRSGKGNLDIWLKQVAGGDPIPLTRNSADDHQPDFSPDGSQIVFRSDREGGGIYLISTLGGGEERLVAPLGRNPRFSPRGGLIAYWTGHIQSRPLGAQASYAAGGLFVVSSTGGPPRKVETGFSAAGSPIWSPDGNYLLFYGHATELYSLGATTSDWWVVSKDGGAPIKTGAFDVLGGQQIERILPAPVPLPNQWVDNHILFSAQLGDSVNLWKVSITSGTWRVTGPAEQLTSGSALEIRHSVARDGTLVFSSLVENSDIWVLPVDTNQGTPVGQLEQVTHEQSGEFQPSVSVDGKTLVYASDRAGHLDIRQRDLESEREKGLTAMPGHEGHPEISADGAQVAYVAGGGIHVVSRGGGVSENVCELCGFPWDWTPDNKRLSFHGMRDSRASVYLLDLANRQKTLLLHHPSFSLHQANFSPDGRWVAFVAVGPGCRVFVARLQGEAAIPEGEWIALSNGSTWDDKPRWSPDGNLLYFTSDRDGFACLWAVRLDPATKQPREEPSEVYHFHKARLSMTNVGYQELEISVARDKIVLNLGELTGNIWMTKLDLK